MFVIIAEANIVDLNGQVLRPVVSLTVEFDVSEVLGVSLVLHSRWRVRADTRSTGLSVVETGKSTDCPLLTTSVSKLRIIALNG